MAKNSKLYNVFEVLWQHITNALDQKADKSEVIVEEIDPTVPQWAKQSTKPTYTASEVGALPSTTSIPTKVSELTNDSGYLTFYTETDPTVPAWAKEPEKPNYTWNEITDKPFTDGKLNPECLPDDIGGGSENAVEYVEQTLTEEQKAQARANIGTAPAYTYGTTDLTAGVSPLTTGTLYFVYE